jgi:hypothetical protein
MESIYILYAIIALLVLSNIFFIWKGTQLVKQVEDAVNETDNVTNETLIVLERMLSEMKEIDIRGSFESDDEVGVVFNELKDIIQKYQNKL